MKHGPIALIDEKVPVVAIAPGNDVLFEKEPIQYPETVARGGKILSISDEGGAKKLDDLSQWMLTIPESHPFVAPIVYSIPVQLLAYHVAVEKGTDVDQPRNLAKSVTVE